MEKTIPEGQMLAYTMAGSADSSLIIATHGVTDNASSLASLQKILVKRLPRSLCRRARAWAVASF